MGSYVMTSSVLTIDYASFTRID